ncbi:MAG TPA: type I CRISPR-associated protein Cas7 [Verrucomicrobiae bacterium]|nr:type I CRISPR-associated protein Cas7 [Verrucomicrobiae bacterium]
MKQEERKTMSDSRVPRVTGLLVIEVRKSNPNGDPERESSPRQRPDGKGEISPVSIKRKLRDLVERTDGQDSLVWTQLKEDLRLGADADSRFQILESRGRKREEIKKLLENDFQKFKETYWDARLFGNTFLEEGGKDTIRAGVAHFGVGVSVAPIEIEFQTWTNKSGVEEGKDRGMAPMAFRVVKHGLYTVPFFVNPTQARKTGCTLADVQVMLHLLKHAYPHSRSVIRTEVEIIHAHTVVHKDPLGSFSDFSLLDALMPKRIPETDKTKPSELRADYSIPTWDDIKGKVVRKQGDKTLTWADVGDHTDYAL